MTHKTPPLPTTAAELDARREAYKPVRFAEALRELLELAEYVKPEELPAQDEQQIKTVIKFLERVELIEPPQRGLRVVK